MLTSCYNSSKSNKSSNTTKANSSTKTIHKRYDTFVVDEYDYDKWIEGLYNIADKIEEAAKLGSMDSTDLANTLDDLLYVISEIENGYSTIDDYRDDYDYYDDYDPTDRYF